jgi:hypothetical protein
MQYRPAPPDGGSTVLPTSSFLGGEANTLISCLAIPLLIAAILFPPGENPTEITVSSNASKVLIDCPESASTILLSCPQHQRGSLPVWRERQKSQADCLLHDEPADRVAQKTSRDHVPDNVVAPDGIVPKTVVPPACKQGRPDRKSAPEIPPHMANERTPPSRRQTGGARPSPIPSIQSITWLKPIRMQFDRCVARAIGIENPTAASGLPGRHRRSLLAACARLAELHRNPLS